MICRWESSTQFLSLSRIGSWYSLSAISSLSSGITGLQSGVWRLQFRIRFSWSCCLSTAVTVVSSKKKNCSIRTATELPSSTAFSNCTTFLRILFGLDEDEDAFVFESSSSCSKASSQLTASSG